MSDKYIGGLNAYVGDIVGKNHDTGRVLGIEEAATKDGLVDMAVIAWSNGTRTDHPVYDLTLVRRDWGPVNARSPLVGTLDRCPPLLRSWLDLERSRGMSVPASMDWLNGATQRNDTTSRLGEWVSGKVGIPAAIADALRWQMLPHLCAEMGVKVTRKQLDRLSQAISDAPLGQRI